MVPCAKVAVEKNQRSCAGMERRKNDGDENDDGSHRRSTETIMEWSVLKKNPGRS